MIMDNKRWHSLAAKNLSALFNEIISKHKGNFFCPHSFRTDNKLKIHENVCKNHDYCFIEMPKKEKKHIKI